MPMTGVGEPRLLSLRSAMGASVCGAARHPPVTALPVAGEPGPGPVRAALPVLQPAALPDPQEVKKPSPGLAWAALP
eukprot:7981494-Heterocapsa_arctica.AAC.1